MRICVIDLIFPKLLTDMPSSDDVTSGISKLHITSGSRTYRIPSPTRPNSVRHPLPQHNENKKGFYMFGNQVGLCGILSK